MIYEARLKDDAYSEAIELADEWAADDYYSRHPRRLADRRYSGRHTDRKASTWTDFHSDAEECAQVTWLTCGGNEWGFRFDHEAEVVTLIVDAARDAFAGTILADRLRDGDWQVGEMLEYSTAAPHWEPWDTLQYRKPAEVPPLYMLDATIGDVFRGDVWAFARRLVRERREGDERAWEPIMEVWEQHQQEQKRRAPERNADGNASGPEVQKVERPTD